jgi:SSS family solute:Na+ symporter
MLYDTPNPVTGKTHFGGSQYALTHFGFDTKMAVYTGLIALIVNLLVVVVGSLVLHAVHAPAGEDVTKPRDFEVEAGDPDARPLPGTPEQEAREGDGRFRRDGEPAPAPQVPTSRR